MIKYVSVSIYLSIYLSISIYIYLSIFFSVSKYIPLSLYTCKKREREAPEGVGELRGSPRKRHRGRERGHACQGVRGLESESV